MLNARVLTADAGSSLRERLAQALPEAVRDAALGAADAAAVVVEGSGPAAMAAAVALREAGAFADVAGGRLVVSGTRRAFEAAGARVAGQSRALLMEVLRAVEADRRPPAYVRLRDRRLEFGGGAKVMGILNVTPDSFYDRGAYNSVDRARSRAAEMVAEGAGVIDIGGRSYAASNPPVDEREERDRVVPVVAALVRDGLGVALSVDTVDARVAEAALDAGAHLINDCSGLADAGLAAAVARYGAGLVVMHLKGELNVRAPRGYRYVDALDEIAKFLRERTELALAAGVARDALVVDPGLEFGKETETDLELLRRFGDLRSLGYPLLLAASRKRFIGRVFDRPATELLVPSLAAAAVGVAAGACLVRAHDVAATVELVKMLGAVRHEGAPRGYVARMENTADTSAVPGQADPLDAGTGEAASPARNGSGDGDALTTKLGRTLGLTDAGTERVDDELQRPPEDRSPLT